MVFSSLPYFSLPSLLFCIGGFVSVIIFSFTRKWITTIVIFFRHHFSFWLESAFAYIYMCIIGEKDIIKGCRDQKKERKKQQQQQQRVECARFFSEHNFEWSNLNNFTYEPITRRYTLTRCSVSCERLRARFIIFSLYVARKQRQPKPQQALDSTWTVRNLLHGNWVTRCVLFSRSILTFNAHIKFSSMSISFRMRAWKLPFSVYDSLHSIVRSRFCQCGVEVSVRERCGFALWLYQTYYMVFTSILFVLFFSLSFDVFQYVLCRVFFSSVVQLHHSFMDTWLSLTATLLYWEFENNQFFVVVVIAAAPVSIARSNRMNVFWSRNRWSDFLLLLFLDTTETHEKTTTSTTKQKSRHRLRVSNGTLELREWMQAQNACSTNEIIISNRQRFLLQVFVPPLCVFGVSFWSG